MSRFSYTLSHDGTIVLYADGEVYTVRTDHRGYATIADALKREDYHTALSSLDFVARLADYVSSTGLLRVDRRRVYYRDRELKFAFVQRLIHMLEEGAPVANFVRYIERSMMNPSRTCIEELFKFSDNPQKRTPLPLLPDGRVLAYKTVREDWYDWHTGKVLYTPLHIKYADDPRVDDMSWLLDQPGELIGVPRWEVDDNAANLCSTGFHAGTFEYVKRFHAGSPRKFLAVAIDPSQVVAASGESSQDKIRCHVLECRQELTEDYILRALGEEPPTPDVGDVVLRNGDIEKFIYVA